MLAVWFVFLATLGLYPAVFLNIKSTHFNENTWIGKYWAELTV